MTPLEWLFWAALAVVVYTYAVYPIAIGVLDALIGRSPRLGPAVGSVSIVVTALNEAGSIAARLRELAGLITASGRTGEVILVSDGSTDRTADEARQCGAGELVRVIELTENVGKAAALTLGCQAARYDILVLADARQRWAADALDRLLENFDDPRIGAVSGDLVLETAPGMLAGVGLYWRFEKWLRRREGRVHSTVGVTGAIAAVRRPLFRPIPPRTILDDVYWPLNVAMQGYRVVHDDRARAFDRLPERTRDELRRKIRTLSGNFQLLTLLPAALLPGRNPIWVQYLSHKLARLIVPWALLVILITSAILPGPGYRAFLGLQAAGYLIGLAGLNVAVGQRFRAVSALASFLVLNTAAWLAFWVWLFGRAERSWHKVAYSTQGAD